MYNFNEILRSHFMILFYKSEAISISEKNGRGAVPRRRYYKVGGQRSSLDQEKEDLP